MPAKKNNKMPAKKNNKMPPKRKRKAVYDVAELVKLEEDQLFEVPNFKEKNKNLGISFF